MAIEAQAPEDIVRSCCRMDHGGCGILIHLKDGKPVRIEGDPDCPINRGTLCSKGLAGLHKLYSPRRLKYPLLRDGERGEGKWKRISWDEALDLIATRMLEAKEEFGAESVVFGQGTHRSYEYFLWRLANVFGSPNVMAAGYLCYYPRVIGSHLTHGFYPIPDYEYPPSCIMMWGNNVVTTSADGVCGAQLLRALDRGSKFIVIDPRYTPMAARADIWVQLRPATDLALALGMLNVIIEEGLYDREFVRDWTFGFDELRERVREYPPEEVERITWVPAEILRAAARLYATSKPASIQWGVAWEQNVNAVQTARAMSFLRAVTGNLDVPGGDRNWTPPPVVKSTAFMLPNKLPPEQQAKMLGADKFKLAVLGQTLAPQLVIKAILEEKPYLIKVLYLHGTNPLVTLPNVEEAYQALMKVDFSVLVDLFMTPSAELADVVLPAASYLELNDIGNYWQRCGLLWVRQKVAQIGEAWSDQKIMNELGKRLGYEEYFWSDVEESLDYILEPAGVTFEEFKRLGYLQGRQEYRKYRKKGFKTPSGKAELYSQRFADWGYDPLPAYQEPPGTPYSDPQLAEEYPLIMTTSRIPAFFHSENREIPILREVFPEPVMEIHCHTAAQLGIADNDWVYIQTKRGRIKQKAYLTENIDPRVVMVSYGWWFPEEGVETLHGFRRANINVLVGNDPPYDPFVGAIQTRGIVCKVYPAED